MSVEKFYLIKQYSLPCAKSSIRVSERGCNDTSKFSKQTEIGPFLLCLSLQFPSLGVSAYYEESVISQFCEILVVSYTKIGKIK